MSVALSNLRRVGLLAAALMLGAGAQAQVPPSATANPVASQPLDALAATRERPLFSPTRRPVPPPAVIARVEPPPPPPPAPPEPPSLALFGIVMDGEGARAVVRASSSDKVVRLRIGDEIGGWQVTQIERQRLVVSLNERSATFTLFNGENASQIAGGDPVYKPPGRTVQVNPVPRRGRRGGE
jgi:hypothetical protein